jgi:plastocyanin
MMRIVKIAVAPGWIVRCVAAALAMTALACSPAAAALPGAQVSATQVIPEVSYPGIQHLHYRYGPLAIAPGQNTIDTELDNLKPSQPGFITRFAPNLVYVSNGKVPRVDVIHLHHGVWLINGYPTLAAGEEKTILQLPDGYGLRNDPSDSWALSYMIHNLTPNATKVYLTYDVDFVPASQALTPVSPIWMDVAGLQLYPVFDALKRKGQARYTFPDDAGAAQRSKVGSAHEWRVPADITLVAATGHLHPGGLWNDLTATRGGQRKELFRSVAKYFEPAGAVSWDVATTATKPDWKVALRAGDRINVSTTYDTHKASWYESMGIDVVFYADGVAPGAVDPFTSAVDWHGEITHGHLPENDHHGGGPLDLPDPRRLLSGHVAANVNIFGFVYGRGDLSASNATGRPPVVRAGDSLTFTNLDATTALAPHQSAYHTITACRAPCNRETGVAYPIADGPVQFDSGELGYGPAGGTPAANRNTWKTPRSLKPGTYSYFCRIHPYMRGAFRVVAR